jgi:hypothetical protein
MSTVILGKTVDGFGARPLFEGPLPEEKRPQRGEQTMRQVSPVLRLFADGICAFDKGNLPMIDSA